MDVTHKTYHVSRGQHDHNNPKKSKAPLRLSSSHKTGIVLIIPHSPSAMTRQAFASENTRQEKRTKGRSRVAGLA